VLPDAAGLDSNLVQSSHGAQDHDNGLFMEHDYALTPPQPTLDGDPRYGASQVVHTTGTHGFQTRTPPTSGRGQDWLLIIEDAAQNRPLRGAAK
jgi:hypothetical protein